MSHIKYFKIDGKEYSKKELVKILDVTLSFVNTRLLGGATSFKDFERKGRGRPLKPKVDTDYGAPMIVDPLGHWKLLNKCLRPNRV